MYIVGCGGTRLLEMPHLHEEEFQMLLDMTLYKERKFSLPISYLTSSSEVTVGDTGLHSPGHTSLRQGASHPIPADLRKRFQWFGTCLDPTLAPCLLLLVP